MKRPSLIILFSLFASATNAHSPEVTKVERIIVAYSPFDSTAAFSALYQEMGELINAAREEGVEVVFYKVEEEKAAFNEKLKKLSNEKPSWIVLAGHGSPASAADGLTDTSIGYKEPVTISDLKVGLSEAKGLLVHTCHSFSQTASNAAPIVCGAGREDKVGFQGASSYSALAAVIRSQEPIQPGPILKKEFIKNVEATVDPRLQGFLLLDGTGDDRAPVASHTQNRYVFKGNEFKQLDGNLNPVKFCDSKVIRDLAETFKDQPIPAIQVNEKLANEAKYQKPYLPGMTYMPLRMGRMVTHRRTTDEYPAARLVCGETGKWQIRQQPDFGCYGTELDLTTCAIPEYKPTIKGWTAFGKINPEIFKRECASMKADYDRIREAGVEMNSKVCLTDCPWTDVHDYDRVKGGSCAPGMNGRYCPLNLARMPLAMDQMGNLEAAMVAFHFMSDRTYEIQECCVESKARSWNVRAAEGKRCTLNCYDEHSNRMTREGACLYSDAGREDVFNFIIERPIGSDSEIYFRWAERESKVKDSIYECVKTDDGLKPQISEKCCTQAGRIWGYVTARKICLEKELSEKKKH